MTGQLCSSDFNGGKLQKSQYAHNATCMRRRPIGGEGHADESQVGFCCVERLAICEQTTHKERETNYAVTPLC